MSYTRPQSFISPNTTAHATPVMSTKPLEKIDTLTDTVVGEEEGILAKTSALRKGILLAMFTCAQFLDAFNNSALFPAMPTIQRELSFLPSETGWLISAYQLTFAAFLLVSGRISDVYSPKPAFIGGALILGLTHLGGGFVRQKIAILVLRALGGIGGALTIPSSLSLIVQLFPDPGPQAIALAIFGMAGGIGNVLGVIIGALFVQYTDWPWVFWFTTIFSVLIAAVCFVLIPNATTRKQKVGFDSIGVSILTSAMVLFIFAVTSGASRGWGTAYVLAPLIISVGLAVCFFVWEARIDPDDAVLPPKMWRFVNFGPLAAIALMPYFWWIGVFVLLTEWWQGVFGWSAMNAAVHFLPIGVGAFVVGMVASQLPKYFQYKWIILAGTLLMLAGTIFLPFANSPDHYWRLNFPAFVIGTSGSMLIFAGSSIAIFATTPPEVAGIVGAVFNGALQLGSAVGLAALTSISTSVNSETGTDRHAEEFSHDLAHVTASEWRNAFRGRAAAFWFLLGCVAVQVISLLVFMRTEPRQKNQDPADSEFGGSRNASRLSVVAYDKKGAEVRVTLKPTTSY